VKALTLWRPWPWAIFHAPHNPKRIENRPWKPWPSIIDRRIVLHAGQTFDKGAVDDVLELTRPEDECDLVRVLPASATDTGLIGVATIQGVAVSEAEAERFMPGQSEWWSGPYAWLLKDVRVFSAPIPCKGKQGLWDLPLWAVQLVQSALETPR
jgi:hypothetical protein